MDFHTRSPFAGRPDQTVPHGNDSYQDSCEHHAGKHFFLGLGGFQFGRKVGMVLDDGLFNMLIIVLQKPPRQFRGFVIDDEGGYHLRQINLFLFPAVDSSKCSFRVEFLQQEGSQNEFQPHQGYDAVFIIKNIITAKEAVFHSFIRMGTDKNTVIGAVRKLIEPSRFVF